MSLGNYKKNWFKLTIVLLIVGMVFILLFKQFHQPKQVSHREELLVFSNKNTTTDNNKPNSLFTLYLLEGLKSSQPKKTTISSFKLPFASIEMDKHAHTDDDAERKWYNLIETGKNKWLFCNYTGRQGWQRFELSYDTTFRKTKTGDSSAIQGYITDSFITGIDATGKCIVKSSGNFVNADGSVRNYSEDDLMFFKVLNLSDKANKCETGELSYLNAVYLDCNSMVFFIRRSISGNSLTKVTFSRETPESGLLEFVSLPFKSGSKKKEAESGAILSNSSGNSVFMRPHWFTPLAASPDKKRIAFIAEYSSSPKDSWFSMERYNYDSQENVRPEIWLSVWDMEANKIEQIETLPDAEAIGVTPFAILWCFAEDSKLVSVYTTVGIYIIDTKEHKTKKILFDNALRNINDVVVIRWSPDGSMLGFLTGEGRLFVYNLEKDTLSLVNEDTNCFNFVWVK
jgi:hypothetical protein